MDNPVPFCHGAHHTEPEPEFAEEIITKKAPRFLLTEWTHLVQKHQVTTGVFLSRRSAFLKVSLSNIKHFWKLFTLKVFVVSIPATKRRLIPCIFHRFCTLLQGHRSKKITPNYPITVAVTHIFYSPDLPDSYHVPEIIWLFQIVTWSWRPDGSSRIIAGKLVFVFTSSKVQKDSFQKYSVKNCFSLLIPAIS